MSLINPLSHCLTFCGKNDNIAGSAWIRHVEASIDLYNGLRPAEWREINDDLKFIFASVLLRGPALTWWRNLYPIAVRAEDLAVTWEMFKSMIELHFG